MKISKLFHWLYASLMLLPFASVVSTTLYYSFNKNAVIPQVDKEVSQEANFNQLVKNGKFNNYENWQFINTSIADFDIDDNELKVTILQGSEPSWTYGFYQISSDLELNHTYVLSCDISSNDISSFRFELGGSNAISLTTGFNRYFVTFYENFNNQFLLYPNSDLVANNSFVVKDFNFYDATDLFLPSQSFTINDFNNWFPSHYYEYQLNTHLVITNYDTIQVADNSINHFWLPSFGAIGYNIQSYIGWVIGGIFGLNVVNGIGFVIVRLFTYWLIISICWLIFDVLMYVPNLVHKWLDKAAID